MKEYFLKKTLTAQLQHNVSTTATEQSTSSTSSITTKQVLNPIVCKAERSLLFNPRKKVEVTESLAKKVQVIDKFKKQSRKEEERGT